MTLFELKQAMATIGQQLAKTETELSQKAMDPAAKIDEIKQIQSTKADLQSRFEVIKQQHDQLEAEQKAKFENNQGIQGLETPEQKMTAAKAELIRSAMRGKSLSVEAKQILGDSNGSGGDKLLPTTMTNELLHEPFVKNPLRRLSTFTSVTNLEIPKISFTLDDDSFIGDTETAKEMEVDGDVVTFKRNKFKVIVPISETVLLSTDTNLIATVENGLSSGLAAKEKKVSFASVDDAPADEKHMSFYGAGIAEVEGTSKLEAIRNAYDDLHEDFRENAKVMMRRQDYTSIILGFADSNALLLQSKPEEIIGFPVEFCDSAIDPIVGDFTYSHFNYDPKVLYEQDKDVKLGVNLFVLTAWIDHQIKLKSAFRIAKVVTLP